MQLTYAQLQQKWRAEEAAKESARIAAIDAAGKPTDVTDHAWDEIRRMGCCARARRTPCVCAVSLQCPDHGIRCYGTHD